VHPQLRWADVPRGLIVDGFAALSTPMPNKCDDATDLIAGLSPNMDEIEDGRHPLFIRGTLGCSVLCGALSVRWTVLVRPRDRRWTIEGPQLVTAPTTSPALAP
jgi:hypothetical protein